MHPSVVYLLLIAADLAFSDRELQLKTRVVTYRGVNRDNPVEVETSLAHDPDGPVPRIVENPTAGFPLIPSFGVRVRF